MSLDKELMKCARCHKEKVILNRFKGKWVCTKCYGNLKQLSNEFDYAKARLIK